MNESVTQPSPEKSSAVRAFFSGFATSSISGAVMMGIVAALGFGATVILGPGVVPAVGWIGAGFMSLASGLFGGVMSVKRSLDSSAASSATSQDRTTVAMPLITQSVGPTAALSVSGDQAEQATSKNWATETGRSVSAQSRVQQILANGSMSDGDRANAILEVRTAPAVSSGLGA